MEDHRHYLAVSLSGNISGSAGDRNLIFFQLPAIDLGKRICPLGIYDPVAFCVETVPFQSARVISGNYELCRSKGRDKYCYYE